MALAAAALAVGIWSSGGRGEELDAKAFRRINRGLGRSADRFFMGVTELGSLYASAAAAAALAVAGHGRVARRALAAAGVTWTVGQGLKRVFRRARPYEADPQGARRMIGRPEGASWPSSHPAVLATFLAVAGRELRAPAVARAALAGLGLAVGASRTYLGVHYPSDAVGGLLVGRAVADAWLRSEGGGLEWGA